jgi:hypothetical protein
MGYFAGARDLRNLLGVAARLRQLAETAQLHADRELYLTAAAALEARARWLGESLPGGDQPDESALHRPVDLIV